MRNWHEQPRKVIAKHDNVQNDDDENGMFQLESSPCFFSCPKKCQLPFNCLQWLLTHVTIEKSALIQDVCSAKYLGLLRGDWSGLRPCLLIQNPGLTLDWPSIFPPFCTAAAVS